MNQLMIDLFNLACMQVYERTFECTVERFDLGWMAICGHLYFSLYDDGRMSFESFRQKNHINQYPLYARYNQFLERGV